MKLTKLIDRLPYMKVYGPVDIDVSGISDDSRKLKEGNLFVAIKGITTDSHDFIQEAISRKISVVVGERTPEEEWLGKITYIQVSSSRRALSLLASAWYDYPTDKLKVIGVTGTDGKTTTCNIIYHILAKNKKKVGLISTIDAKINQEVISTGLHVTNPEPLELQKLLHKMVRNGLEYVVLEVTSHGLDQSRVAGIDFDIGVLTNITHEHLDYHKSWESYFYSKMKLFEKSRKLVLNKDDKSHDRIRSRFKSKECVSYSVSDSKKDADLLASDLKQAGNEQVFQLTFKGQILKARTNLTGEYNASNILASFGASTLIGIDIKSAVKAVENIPALPGRMEEIKNNRGIRIFVDFAHTSKSLESVLKTLLEKTKGRLIAIYGCASERDIRKRTLMPRISTKIADLSVFTAEDPRREDINDILKQMEQAVRTVDKSRYISIRERGEAIYYAINEVSRPGDTVAVLGKGHEKSMAYNGVEYPWSDRKAVEDALKGKVKEIKR